MFYIFLRLSAPEPRAFIIEKSTDQGQSYSPFQYYAEDCMRYFGMENDGPITEPDGVQCQTLRYGRIEVSACGIHICRNQALQLHCV